MDFELEVIESLRQLNASTVTYSREQILSLIDLTSLNEDDNDAAIINLCKKAVTTIGQIAAVCVYPDFVPTAKKCLQQTTVKIATVANFPHATDAVDAVLTSIKQSIKAGAQEVDVVFPYHAFLKGDKEQPAELIQACKKVCGNNIILKVILETGAIKNLNLIAEAARSALNAGADFIKTSTGKISTGATLEAAASMLLALKNFNQPRGLKVSGGIRTIDQAIKYIALAEIIMGNGWISKTNFRIGASQLVDSLS